MWLLSRRGIVQVKAGARASSSAALALAAEGNLVRFTTGDGKPQWGRLAQAAAPHAFPLPNGPLGSIQVEPGAKPVKIAELLAPVPVDPPPAIIGIGLNYRAHAEETKQELPKFPIMFYKSPASVIGPGGSSTIPLCAREKPEVDFEAELAIVIGKRALNVKAADAFDVILGVTAANDLSARRWQGKKGGGQWSFCKSFDGFCPLGPSILPVREGTAEVRQLLAAGAGLRLRAVLNGKEMQDTLTNDMIFGISQIVEFLSQGTTLLPGTLILTGTPSGVGFTRSPPVYLAPGDEVSITLEKVGALTTTIS